MADDRVLFTIEAENEQLKAKLAETEAALRKLQSTGEATDNSAGLSFKNSISAIKSWIGSIGAAIGVGIAFAKAVDVIGASFTSAAKYAGEFKESLGFNLTDAGLAAAQRTVADLKKELDEAVKGGERGVFGDIGAARNIEVVSAKLQAAMKLEEALFIRLLKKKRLEEDKERTEKTDKDAKTAAKADEERVARMEEEQRKEEQQNEESRQRRTQQALEDANRIADATLSAEDKIARKRFDTIERAKVLITQAQTDLDRFAAESLIKAANLEAAYELKKLEDERTKKRLDTERKAAEEYAKTVTDRLRPFFDELNRANQQFGNNLGDRLNGTLEAIRQDMNRIRLAIPQNGGGSGIFGIEGTY